SNGACITARSYSKQGRQIVESHATDTAFAFPIWRPGERASLGACVATNAWGRNATQRDRSSVGYLFLDALGRLFLFRTHTKTALELVASGVTAFAPDRSGGMIVIVNRDLDFESHSDRRR